MRLVLSVALAALLTGCDALVVPSSDPVMCTLIGCESQVQFELSEDLVPDTTYQVEGCIDGQCTSASIEVLEGGGISAEGSLRLDTIADTAVLILDDGDYDGIHAVSLSIDGPDGLHIEIAAETEFQRSQPNGPGCEPVCWQATIVA